MTTTLDLAPEVERFARECVESGRYDSVSAVVDEALRLLQARDERRQNFETMLRETEAEVERDGTVPLETVLAEMDEIIGPAGQR